MDCKNEIFRLVDEDFKSFKVGCFPTDMSAMGEYHYYPPEGHTGIWYEPNKDTAWMSRKCWMVKEEGGQHFIEQEIDTGSLPWIYHTLPMLVTGEVEWKNYNLSVLVRPLSFRNICGLAFCYTDSRHFYFLALAEGKYAVLYKKEEEELSVLLKVDFCYDCDTFYRLDTQACNGHIVCSIDGKTIISLDDSSYPTGRIAIAAHTPARFTSITVDMPQEDYSKLLESKKAYHKKLEEKRKAYPFLKLWKSINLKDFGAGRSIRYGDLTGNGRKDLLFIQSMPCLNTPDESMISCMTAVDLDGNVLWQIGEPDPANGLICADLPVQIYDIDGDGLNEVIYCKDFRIIVADGRTGNEKYSVNTPMSLKLDRYKIYQNSVLERIIGDSIRICNFSGKERPSDILLKDRYNNIWAYDSGLNLLWHRSVNSGHFPFNYDFNGDGRDELVAGHSLISADGKLLWELPDMGCHVDEIVVGRFDPENSKLLIAMASGEDGFLLVDQNGNILVQDHIGHVQRVSVADYRPDLPGLEYCVTTFWRNTGIIVYYDCKGNRIFSHEPGVNGNVICPVNWTGDGRELILYSANLKHGGLYDGFGDQVLLFPDDGHPDLCCDAVDLLGDSREELLAWDLKRMCIYTQEDCPKSTDYVPDKYEGYNYSNYRGEYSFPKWRNGG